MRILKRFLSPDLLLPVLFICLFPFDCFAIGQYSELITKGVEQLKAADFNSARNTFEKATRVYSNEPTGFLFLGVAFFNLKEDYAAEKAFNKSIQLNPKESNAYLFLGDLSYRRNDLRSAQTYWEKAIEVNPAATRAKEKLEKMKRERAAESHFSQKSTRHFSVKYEGGEKAEIGEMVLSLLEEAYEEVEKELGVAPDQDIPVILYSEKQFKDVTQGPEWEIALYDGKIRVPIGGGVQTENLRKILYHEYTHAAIRSITARCPKWLNEGLAQYFEGRKIGDNERKAIAKALKPIKENILPNLETSFRGYNRIEASSAYLLSLSAAGYMADTYGMQKVSGVLKDLVGNTRISVALQNNLYVSLEQFELEWRASLE
jgi:tetratricopeptide (TPR) repeat protein